MENYQFENEYDLLAKDGIDFFQIKSYSQRACAPAHIHSAIEILFIQAGSFQIFADDVPYIVREGDTVLFRSNTIHRVYALEEKECSYYVLKVQPTLICDFAFQDQSSKYLIHFTLNSQDKKSVWTAPESVQAGIHTALATLIREFEEKAYCFDLSMKINTAAILLALLRSSKQNIEADENLSNENMVRRIYNTVLYINSHYPENLTAEACGNQVYMSYSYFSRCFRKVTGKSFKEYLNTVRINHAEKALLTSQQSITEIASACGFNSVSYFIATYKKLKGVTPLEFRKTCR